MLNAEQLKSLIIIPTISTLKLFSDSAVNLLMFTCAVESKGGSYLKQIKGPALGIYQMEPASYNDLWQGYIRNRLDLSLLLSTNFDCYRQPLEDRLVYDLQFATAMSRIFYYRVPQPLPDAKDLDGIWNYYKQHYNTHLGKTKKDKAMKDYADFIK